MASRHLSFLVGSLLSLLFGLSYGSIPQQKTFEDAKSWVKSQIRSAKKNFPIENKLSKATNPFEGQLLIFASFSMPDSVWLELSQEAKIYRATIVMRGIPDNSFQAFSKKLLSLQKKGMDADVEIDPKKFKQYRIRQVPSFVIADSKTHDKVSGNISLKYFLEKASEEGESILAKHIINGGKQ